MKKGEREREREKGIQPQVDVFGLWVCVKCSVHVLIKSLLYRRTSSAMPAGSPHLFVDVGVGNVGMSINLCFCSIEVNCFLIFIV